MLRGRGSCPGILIGLAIAQAAASPARADVLVINGGFEAGLAGWTRVDQLGSEGTFFLQTGTASPVNATTVPAPPAGVRAAMSDAQGPGAHVLYQDFLVPAIPIVAARVTFDLFVGNRATAFSTPNPASLDFSTPALNQQARVDILRSGTDPFSVSALDVLANVYQTRPGDPLVSGYTTVSLDVTTVLAANIGNTLRLRFAEVDNVFTFQFGVDNVSLITTPIPEPSCLALCGLGALFGWGYCGRCRRNSTIRGQGPSGSQTLISDGPRLPQAG
jgi:hypothetical protein